MEVPCPRFTSSASFRKEGDSHVKVDAKVQGWGDGGGGGGG